MKTKPFKNIKAVRAYIEEHNDKIRCLECGKLYGALGTHLQRMHSMTGDDYREKYKIPYSYSLVSPSTKIKMKEHLEQNFALGYIDREKAINQNINKLIKCAKDGNRRICPHRIELSLEHLAKAKPENKFRKKTEEEKKLMAERMKKVWENKTEKDIEEEERKRRNTVNNWTLKQKKEFGKKLRDAWFNHSEEEKNRIRTLISEVKTQKNKERRDKKNNS